MPDHDSKAIHEALAQFDRSLSDIDRRLRRSQQTTPDSATKSEVLEVLHGLERSLKLQQEAHGEPGAQLRDQVAQTAGKWLFRSKHFARAYHKPHGFPGDYQMLEWMYDLAGDSCADPTQPGIVNSIDYTFSQVDPVLLLPERRAWLRGHLVEEYERRGRQLKVLDIACGGARYCRDFLGQVGGAGIELTLVEQDASALEFCRIRSLKEWTPSLRLVCVPIQKLHQAPIMQEKYDVVLSAGLLDYFDDPTTKQLLALLSACLVDGGLLAVTNVHPSENSRVLRDWIVHWPLILRDPDHLARLMPPKLDVLATRSERGALTLAQGRLVKA